MTEFTDSASRYLNAWNESIPSARRKLIEQLFTSGVRYVDPMVEIVGHQQLDETIAAVHQQFPGFAFRLAGPVDGHHQQVRFGWELGPLEGEAPVAGFDVALVDSHGKIEAVYGFLDRVPGV